MPPLVNMVGRTFGRLTAVRHSGYDKHGKALWECECSCGNTKVAEGALIRSGRTASCGCLSRDVTTRLNVQRTIRTKASKFTYVSWYSARRRCTDPRDPSWDRYGGRGITMCKQWSADFWEFYRDMGDRAEGLTLGRINNNGHYEPGNCRWETDEEQARNRTSSKLTLDDAIEIHRLSAGGISNQQIADLFHISRASVRSVKQGKSWREAAMLSARPPLPEGEKT